MEIRSFIWLERFVQKNILKHNVYPEEIEDFFGKSPSSVLLRRGI